ncbi:hypothetical protein D3C76_1714390 [compost metagenome]
MFYRYPFRLLFLFSFTVYGGISFVFFRIRFFLALLFGVFESKSFVITFYFLAAMAGSFRDLIAMAGVLIHFVFHVNPPNPLWLAAVIK